MTTTPNPVDDQPANHAWQDDQVNPQTDPEENNGNPPARCANCDGEISQDDIVCPHCGIPLAAG